MSRHETEFPVYQDQERRHSKHGRAQAAAPGPSPGSKGWWEAMAKSPKPTVDLGYAADERGHDWRSRLQRLVRPPGEVTLYMLARPALYFISALLYIWVNIQDDRNPVVDDRYIALLQNRSLTLFAFQFLLTFLAFLDSTIRLTADMASGILDRIRFVSYVCSILVGELS